VLFCTGWWSLAETFHNHPSDQIQFPHWIADSPAGEHPTNSHVGGEIDWKHSIKIELVFFFFEMMALAS
jgi:hypothetical protein